MKNSIIIAFFLGIFAVNGQILNKMAIGTDYTYRGRNAFGVGLEYRLSDMEKPSVNIAARMLYTPIAGKAKILPEFRADYNLFHAFHLGTSLTPYAIEPRFGLNLLNVVVINTGYAIPIDKNHYFRGITFGVRMNLSLRKAPKTEFYDNLKMGF